MFLCLKQRTCGTHSMLFVTTLVLGLCLGYCRAASTGKSSPVTPKTVSLSVHNKTSDLPDNNEIPDSSSSPTNKPFVSLTAECENATFRLNLHTSEPFNGWFYTRDHQTSCSQRGSGQTITTLMVSSLKPCGVKTVLKAKEFRKTQESQLDDDLVEEVALYVQHDEFVQQVIDEQFLVHCKKGQSHGVVSYQDDNPLSSSVDQVVTKIINTQPGKEEKLVIGGSGSKEKFNLMVSSNISSFEPRSGLASTSNSFESGTNLDKDDIKVEDAAAVIQVDDSPKFKQYESEDQPSWKPMAVIRHRDMMDFRSNPISGWMEITSASTYEPIEDRPVMVGKLVNLDIRLQQSRNRDTMVSSCVVHGSRAPEEEERQRRRTERGFYQQANDEILTQDLTDYRGCSLNTNVLQNFAASFNSMTSVKKLTATFPIFKFPGRSRLTFKCSVLVCRNNCPVAKCESGISEVPDGPQEEFLNVKIMEKFMLETSIEVVERGSQAEGIFEDTRERSNRIVRLLESSPLHPDTDSLRQGASLHHKSSQLQVDENSKFSESGRKLGQSEQLEIPPEKSDEPSTVQLDEDQLCLSPSRLVLGFGILLVILLLALVASCMMWMRARSYSRRPKPSAILASPPPPPPQRVSPNNVTARVATPSTAAAIVSTRPYFVAPRYIRVMH